MTYKVKRYIAERIISELSKGPLNSEDLFNRVAIRTKYAKSDFALCINKLNKENIIKFDIEMDKNQVPRTIYSLKQNSHKN